MKKFLHEYHWRTKDKPSCEMYDSVWRRALQCDYYNHGHLDKVGRSDYRKITVHSEKASYQSWLPRNEINNMDGNQPIRTYRSTWPFVPAEESLCFLRGLLDWVTGAKNVNVSCNFDLRWNFIAKHGNGREEIACRWKQKTACQTKQICLVGVICKVSNRKTSSGEIFCFLGKRLLSIFKLFASSNFLFYNELLVGPQPPFLESGPGYSSRTVRKCSLSILLW